MRIYKILGGEGVPMFLGLQKRTVEILADYMHMQMAVLKRTNKILCNKRYADIRRADIKAPAVITVDTSSSSSALLTGVSDYSTFCNFMH